MHLDGVQPHVEFFAGGDVPEIAKEIELCG